jgi:hypothetical protein
MVLKKKSGELSKKAKNQMKSRMNIGTQEVVAPLL